MLSRKDCELLVLIEAFLFEWRGAVCGGVGGVFAMSSSHYNQSTRRIGYDGGSTPPVFYHDSTLHVITTKRDSGSILSSMCRTSRSVRIEYVYYSILYICVCYLCYVCMYVCTIWFDSMASIPFGSIRFYTTFPSIPFPSLRFWLQFWLFVVSFLDMFYIREPILTSLLSGMMLRQDYGEYS